MRQLPEVYSQRDPKWANQRLGTVDGTTIGSGGCYTTSFSMLACYYGHMQTPAQMDDFFTSHNFYVSGNLCTDDILQKSFQDCVFQKTYDYNNVPADLNLLKSLLNDPTVSVILEVDFNHNPSDGIQTHFVVAIDCDGAKVTIADPWYGSVDDFSKNYGNTPTQTIQKFVVYKGKPAVTVTPPSGNIYKGLDLNNPDSMKVAVDIWDAVINQHQYVTVSDFNAVAAQLSLAAGSNKDQMIAAITDLKSKEGEGDTLWGYIQTFAGILNVEANRSDLGATKQRVTDALNALVTAKETAETSASTWEGKAVDPDNKLLYKDLFAQAESDIETPVNGYKAQITKLKNQLAQTTNIGTVTGAKTSDLISEIFTRAINRLLFRG